MADVLMQPGFGGEYISEVFSGDGDGADTVDISRCNGFGVQVEKVSGTPVGTVQIKHTYGAPTYANFSTPIDLANDGAITRFPGPLNDPVGKIKFSVTLAGGSVKLRVYGTPHQITW